MWIWLLLAAALLVGVPLLFRLVSRNAKGRPGRHTMADLAARLGMSPDELEGFEPVFAERSILKRGSSRGGRSRKRRLHIPDAHTKALQKKILRRILAGLKVHPAATAFEKGCSVAHNAGVHARRPVVIKMDFVDFFPSIRADAIQAYFERIGWDAEAASCLARLTTHRGALPQGAPTSPALSNRICLPLDAAIDFAAKARGGIYTRYADDITVSLPQDDARRVRGVIQRIGRISRRHGYQIHKRRKLRILRRHHSQQVTGLVVNEGVRLPRRTRRWLRAVQHRFEVGGAPSLKREELRGWLAYQAQVEQVRRQLDAARAAR